MFRLLSFLVLTLCLFSLWSCTPSLTKGTTYKEIYNTNPHTILVMPPINKTTNVEAKELFHSTLSQTLSNMGYYVVPLFLSLEVFKKESAYDAENFINQPLNNFAQFFGSDLVLFTIIHKWDKSVVFSKIYVDIEYIIKSSKTNQIVFQRKGNITYDASIQTQGGGLVGALISAAASAISTGLTRYTKVAAACNNFTLGDMPQGRYSPLYHLDSSTFVGPKEFRAVVR